MLLSKIEFLWVVVRPKVKLSLSLAICIHECISQFMLILYFILAQVVGVPDGQRSTDNNVSGH